MKKLVLTTLMVISLTSAGLFAQGVSGGLKGGLNLSNQDTGGDIDTKMKVGYHVGAFATIMFNEKMGIQPEVLYSAQGSAVDEDGVDANLNFTYVTVPVLFRYNASESLHFVAGPQFGFLTKAELDVDGDTEDLKDYLKGSDVCGAIGAGYDLSMGLGFGARYVFGFSNIVEDSDNGEWKNSSNIQLFVSYKLFGKK